MDIYILDDKGFETDLSFTVHLLMNMNSKAFPERKCCNSHGKTQEPIYKMPGDFVTKVKQTNFKQSISFNFDVKFCRSVLPHNQIVCLHNFNLRSLYFQSSKSLPNSFQLHMWEIPQSALYFNEQITRTYFFLL